MFQLACCSFPNHVATGPDRFGVLLVVELNMGFWFQFGRFMSQSKDTPSGGPYEANQEGTTTSVVQNRPF